MRALRCCGLAAAPPSAVRRPTGRAAASAGRPSHANAAAAACRRLPALASRRGGAAAAMPPVCAHSIGVMHDDDSDDEDAADYSGQAPPPPPGCRWRRVMLKISGEALAGEAGFGIDADLVLKFAKEVAAMALEGVQVAIVVGGGNFFRGKEREGKGLDRASADYMGMLATVMNALQLQAALESVGVPVRVQTAIDMKEVAEPYIRRRAIRHLEKGRVVIFGAGTGNPFFTTDTGAALRAAEINAQALLKATKVDGVYDCDPKRNPGAKLHAHLSYSDVITRQELGAMDTTAVTLCAENSIPVVVFNLFTEGNIKRAIRGENVGTRVGTPWHPLPGAAPAQAAHGGEGAARCDVPPLAGAAAAKRRGSAAASARAHR